MTPVPVRRSPFATSHTCEWEEKTIRSLPVFPEKLPGVKRLPTIWGFSDRPSEESGVARGTTSPLGSDRKTQPDNCPTSQKVSGWQTPLGLGLKSLGLRTTPTYTVLRDLCRGSLLGLGLLGLDSIPPCTRVYTRSPTDCPTLTRQSG